MAVAEARLVPITQAQVQVIESRHLALLERAQALVVDSPDGEEAAWAIVNAIGELKNIIEADFAGPKTTAHAAHKAVIAQEKAHLDRLDKPDKIVRAKLVPWEQEKRRIQAELERHAREVAEKAAAELRKQAEEQAQKDAEERRLTEAVAAEAAGDAAKAEELLEAPVVAEPVVEPVTPFIPVLSAPKVEGAGAMVTVWKFEIVDQALIPREYLSVNESAIGKVVQALKGGANIPGVRVYSTLEARRTRGRVR